MTMAGKGGTAGISIGAILVIVAGLWILFSGDENQIDPARPDHLAFPVPAEPSILVLPFEWQQSGDGERRADHDLFARSVGRQLIMSLSRLPGIFVMSMRTSETFAGPASTTPAIAAERTGVRYVLTGRLQAVAEEQRDLVMKVTLIDTATGNYVGEFTFELEAKQTRGLFFHDLGDRIFRAVLTSLDIEPGERLLQHALRRDIGRFGILNFIHDAEVTWSEFSEESNNRVIAEAKTRIKRRPQEVALHVLLAWGQWAKLANGWTHGLAGGYKRMADPAKRALEISPDYPPARSLQAVVNIWGGKTENAVTSCQEAKSLGPSDAHVAFDCGLVYLLAGQYEDALAETERGLRLHPDPPVFRRDVLAEIYRVSGRGEDMRRIDEQIIAGKTRPWQTVPAHLRLLVTEADAGNVEAARKRLARIREIAPETSLDIYRGRFRYRDPKVMAKFYATLDAVQNEP